MKNQPNTSETDLADEHYTGPNAAVVAAGNGVFQHLKWAFIGLGVGVAGAALFPRNVAKLLDASRGFATQLKTYESSNVLDIAKRSFGKVIHTLIGEGKNTLGKPVISPDQQEWLNHAIMNRELGFGHWFSTHAANLIPKLGRSFKNTLLAASEQPAGTNAARWTNALTFGGTLGAAGYVGGWAGALLHGAKHGSDPEHQVRRLQQGLRDERDEKMALLQKVTQQQHELSNLKTSAASQDGTLKVAPDQPPVIAENSPPALLDSAGANRTSAAREPITPPEHRDWQGGLASERAAEPTLEHARG